MKVYIGLGANVGQPVEQLRAALSEIEARGLGRVLKRSHLYRTEPVGFADQDWFINAAAQIETDLKPVELMQGLRQIEQAAGRNRSREIRNGPRPLDLDIIFIQDCIIDEGDLTVPHPRAHLRGFVLVPVAELEPDFKHPLLGRSVREILARLSDPARVEKMEETL